MEDHYKVSTLRLIYIFNSPTGKQKQRRRWQTSGVVKSKQASFALSYIESLPAGQSTNLMQRQLSTISA